MIERGIVSRMGPILSEEEVTNMTPESRILVVKARAKAYTHEAEKSGDGFLGLVAETYRKMAERMGA